MKTKKRSSIIYAILLFLICISFIVYVFPKEKRFGYEFSEGSPWLYEDMIAPFDFPIHKTDDEIKLEKDNITSNFVPYYSKDTLLGVDICNNYKYNVLDIQENIFKNKQDSIRLNKLIKNEISKNLKLFNDSLLSYLENSYSKGVIDISDTEATKNSVFYFYKNDISELSFFNEYVQLSNIKEKTIEYYSKARIYFIDSLCGFPLRNYLQNNEPKANLTYDNQINQQILDSKLSTITPTKGVVQKGELLILKGSIVGNHENKVLLSLKKEFEVNDKELDTVKVISGLTTIFFMLFLVLFLYMYQFDKDKLMSVKAISFFVIQVTLMVGGLVLVFYYTKLNVNFIPFVLFPLLMLTFYSFRISFFIYLIAILIAGFFVPNRFEFVFIQMLVGLIAMLSFRNTRKRKQIFITMIYVALAYLIAHVGFILMRQGEITMDLVVEYYSYCASASMLLLYLPMVYLYEKIFGFLSDFTLMELSDTNNPALRKLAEMAPGTFQHSVQVANLVESVVSELGGNSLLARTGALYHDIGKSEFPEYFIENQSGMSVHSRLSYEESAEKIISHVIVGTEIAKKYKLPTQITDFILMHHGTSLTKYFYNSWINENPDKTPDESKFQYPGPKPSSIEAAVLMMADAIEAASRTLPKYTPETIQSLVDNIISSQLNENQYDEVNITLKQISIAKSIFAKKLNNIYHSRIAYPEIKN